MIFIFDIDIGNVGLGFAIDGQYAQTIVKRLENGKKIQWSYIGLHFRLLNMEETKENDLEFGSNIIIVKVVQNGVAVGKLRENDIITKMNDVVVSHKTFATMIASLEPRTKITLEVLRDKKIINVELFPKIKKTSSVELISVDAKDSNKINEILFDLKGTPWLATDKGVSRLIENSDVFNLKWPIKNANSIAIARNNAVWFSHDNGLTSVDNHGKETSFVSDPTDINSLLTNETGKILITKRGDVWAASKYGGVTVLSSLENNFTRYENINLSTGSIVPEKINTIYEDAMGTIWLSSVAGVSKFKNGKFSSQYYKPALNTTTCLTLMRFCMTKAACCGLGRTITAFIH